MTLELQYLYCLSKFICNKSDEMNASQLLKIPRFVRQNERLKYWIQKERAKWNEAGLKKVFFYVKPSFVACFCLSDLQRKQIVDWSLGIHKKIFFSFLSFFHPGNAYTTNAFPVLISRKWTANKSHEWLYSIETNEKLSSSPFFNSIPLSLPPNLVCESCVDAR